MDHDPSSFAWTQPPDPFCPADEGACKPQTLVVAVASRGGKSYVVLSTTRWAVEAGDIDGFADHLRWCAAQCPEPEDEPEPEPPRDPESESIRRSHHAELALSKLVTELARGLIATQAIVLLAVYFVCAAFWPGRLFQVSLVISLTAFLLNFSLVGYVAWRVHYALAGGRP